MIDTLNLDLPEVLKEELKKSYEIYKEVKDNEISMEKFIVLVWIVGIAGIKQPVIYDML